MYNSSLTSHSNFLKNTYDYTIIRLQFTDVSKINLEASAFILYFVIIFQPKYTLQNFNSSRVYIIIFIRIDLIELYKMQQNTDRDTS